jgi:hypothetical protein
MSRSVLKALLACLALVAIADVLPSPARAGPALDMLYRLTECGGYDRLRPGDVCHAEPEPVSASPGSLDGASPFNLSRGEMPCCGADIPYAIPAPDAGGAVPERDGQGSPSASSGIDNLRIGGTLPPFGAASVALLEAVPPADSFRRYVSIDSADEAINDDIRTSGSSGWSGRVFGLSPEAADANMLFAMALFVLLLFSWLAKAGAPSIRSSAGASRHAALIPLADALPVAQEEEAFDHSIPSSTESSRHVDLTPSADAPPPLQEEEIFDR